MIVLLSLILYIIYFNIFVYVCRYIHIFLFINFNINFMLFLFSTRPYFDYMHIFYMIILLFELLWAVVVVYHT